LNEIHISDLTNGKSWRIDKKALRHFQETYLKTHSKIKCGAVHWYFPSADGFSPDDTKVLIRMEIEYTYPCTDPMFNPVSYVVDSKSGDILKEYTSIKVPEQWWIDNL
jgi:hypothetical protein